jgi:hypothetical protein
VHTNAVDHLTAIFTDAESTAFHNGVHLGATFEQLRHGLLELVAGLDRGPDDFERSKADELGRIRAEMLDREAKTHPVAA